jgi:hypothetical protein
VGSDSRPFARRDTPQRLGLTAADIESPKVQRSVNISEQKIICQGGHPDLSQISHPQQSFGKQMRKGGGGGHLVHDIYEPRESFLVQLIYVVLESGFHLAGFQGLVACSALHIHGDILLSVCRIQPCWAALRPGSEVKIRARCHQNTMISAQGVPRSRQLARRNFRNSPGRAPLGECPSGQCPEDTQQKQLVILVSFWVSRGHYSVLSSNPAYGDPEKFRDPVCRGFWEGRLHFWGSSWDTLVFGKFPGCPWDAFFFEGWPRVQIVARGACP